MTSHLNSHRTTDIQPEMLSGVQTGNGTPHDKYNIRGIAHTRTNRKEDIFMQRRLLQNFTFILEWGHGTCSLTKHTWCWAYSHYFFPACCLLRFAAFFFLRGGSQNSKFSQFRIFPKLGRGGVIKFLLFPKFKKVQNILGEGGGSSKLWTFSTFCDIF